MKYNERRLKEQRYKIEARMALLDTQHNARVELLTAQHDIKIQELERQHAEVTLALNVGDPEIAYQKRESERAEKEDEDYNNRIKWP